MDDPSTVEVGWRICAEDGYYGTVLYRGPVAGTRGEWLGVEWDSDGRGKHDGEHENVRYFTAPPGRGSFIREKKFRPSTAFMRELVDRYGLQDTPNAGVVAEQLYVDDGSGNYTKVEMVGAEKVNQLQSDFRSLEIVVLRESLIRRLEPNIDLSQFVPNIVELNLSKNLFSTWSDISEITSQLPRLKILDVSENRFKTPENPTKLSESFTKLKTLFLNKMAIDFSTVLAWSDMWPNIQQLHICFNGITKLLNPGQKLNKLKLLNLEGNGLDSCEELLKLQALPELERLILNNTGLREINLDNLKPGGFSSLRELSVCGNLIAEWDTINQLNKLQLTDLKINGNPLLNTDIWENIRELVTAKIRTLKLLNRTEITVDERKGAEFSYLKKFGVDWLKSGGSEDASKSQPSEQFCKMHTRYQELVDKYGAPELSEMYRAPRGLKDNLIQIHIKAPQKTVSKNVPYTMSVQKLKTMVQKLFKADLSTLTLMDIGQGDKVGCSKVELDNDLRDLSFFSVVSGDTIEAVW